MDDQIADPDVSTAIMELTRAELARYGIAVEVQLGADGYELYDDLHDLKIRLAHLSAQASQSARDQWPDLVRRFTAAMVSSFSVLGPAELTPVELRSCLYTRVYPDDTSVGDLSYARELTPGLVVALALDYPQTVHTLTGDLPNQLALGLDEAYRVAQANTDAVEVHTTELLPGVQALIGESFFVAARVANFAALVPEVIGPAPLGVVFAVLNRSLVLYVVLSQTSWPAQVTTLALAIDQIVSADMAHPGGLISPYGYYWNPNGTIDRIYEKTLSDGAPALKITPPPQFPPLQTSQG